MSSGRPTAMMKRYTHIGVLLFTAAAIVSVDCLGLNVTVDPNGRYSVRVDTSTWFSSGSTEFNNNNKTYSTADASLKLQSTTEDSGSDIFGMWNSYNFTYQADSLAVKTSIKTYEDVNVPVAIFSQNFLVPANLTSTSDSDKVISKFPSINLMSVMDGLGYMAYGGSMAGYTGLSFGMFDSSSDFTTGLAGGPLVLFDNQKNAMVISPLSKFMAASNYLDRDKKQVSWGIMGDVNFVPAGYNIDFILFYSNHGINDAVMGWGKYLTTLYGKSNAWRNRDPTIQYFGYWTDNGANYYYHTEPGKNYEETIFDMDNYIKNMSVPFIYYQYDSWWYYKGHIGGTTTWEPKPDIFPDGFNYLSQKTEEPFGCHNQYWDGDTTYAKANGGKYNFIIDKKTGYAVPDDDQFWVDLFNMTQGWGSFILYEQDHLDEEVTRNSILQTDIDLGRRWLMGMGKGAAAFNITIQYCMAFSRHMLQSLEIPVVTQARVSHDYQPGADNWKLGVTSIFVDAINIAPFKDTFWTTVDQPGNHYNRSEPQTELVNAVSTLTTGPVGPGRILKPGTPLKAIDDQIMRKVFQDKHQGPDGEVYTSHTNISGYIFGTILAADLKNNYNITPDAAWPNMPLSTSMSYSTIRPTGRSPVFFDNDSPITLGPQCTSIDFCLYYTSPVTVLPTGELILLMGELDKWVPISPQRISKIEVSDTDMTIFISVQAMEYVNFTIFKYKEQAITTINCDNSNDSFPKLESVIMVLSNLCIVS